MTYIFPKQKGAQYNQIIAGEKLDKRNIRVMWEIDLGVHEKIIKLQKSKQNNSVLLLFFIFKVAIRSSKMNNTLIPS